MADKRIIELANEKLVLADGDMTIVDSESGTYKYDLNRLAKKTITDTTLSIEGKPADAKAVGDALASVDVDTVNNARQLLSEKYVLDEEPYLFRASGGDGADRVEECIVGGSVGWNQLCNAASVTVTSGHKYISKVGSTWTVGTSTGSAITGLTSGTDMVIDLTTLFGPTIADYIYSLETATAGAGVAWFRKYFPEDYYEYSAPTLKYVEGVSSKEVVGKNLLRLPIVQYNAVSADIANCFFIQAGTYCLSFDATATQRIGIRLLDTNGDIYTDNEHQPVTGWSYRSGYQSYYRGTDMSPSHGYCVLNIVDDCYIRIVSSTTGDVYENVQLEFGSKETAYEPYHKNIYPLDSTLTLRGIPKLTDGKMWFDGDKYLPSGQVQPRAVEVDLSTLTYTTRVTGSTNKLLSAFLPHVYACHWSALQDCACDTYAQNAPDNAAGLIENIESCATGLYFLKKTEGQTDSVIYLVIDKNATPQGKLVYLPSVVLQTETATPYTSIQMLDPHGTEEFVSTGIVPVGHESHYLENLRSKIEGLPKDFSTLIAPTEAAYKATQNYTVGSLLIVNNILYKVTSAIANGGTITPNTNCTATTLAAVIAAL